MYGKEKLEDICLRALEMDASIRAAFLRDVCPSDELRIEAESLLAAAEFADDFLEGQCGLRLTSGVPLPVPSSPAIGDEIGPYRLLEKLGEGGMGVVYRASQRVPVRREVALKIIKPGMDSGLVAARFAVERQALALMEHANIARVLDAGTASSDRAWFVMELVDGLPVTAYCDAARLSIPERIGLMIPVCQAIHHAHQKGVIHRDIKPSNILVARDGTPKVIDFGIAKATEQPLHDGATFTRAFDVVGTFEYMSPEQAEPGLRDIDVRSDVYALGAVLYELFTGTPPLTGLSLRANRYSQVVERIQQEVPLAPGQRAAAAGTATAARRRCDPSQLARQLRGECDWIALKALEKDRERRYESAGALARDLQRYLASEPVEASPPSRTYRARKFAARYRLALGAATAFVGALIAAVIWMSIALRQQQRANTDSAALRQIVRKLVIERPAELARMPNRTALRAELMRNTEGALDALSRELRGNDALQSELASAYLAIGLAKGPYNATGSEGDPAEAARYVHKSVELYSTLARSKPGDESVRRGQLEALSTLLHLQYRIGSTGESKHTAREIDQQIARMPPALAENAQVRWYQSIAYLEMGSILWNEGATAEALENQRKALVAFREGVPIAFRQDPEKLEHWSHLQRELAISIWMFQGIGPEAIAQGRRAVEVLTGCGAPNCRMRHAQSLGTLGEMEWASGDQDRGIATLRESVAEFESLLADDPGNAVLVNAGAQVRSYLALALARAGGGSEAVQLAEKNLALPAVKDAALPKGRERTMVYHITMGAALLGAKRFADAEGELRQTLAHNRDWNANLDLEWSAMHLLTAVLEAQARYEEAVAVARKACKLADQAVHGQEFYARVLRAIAARDYASAVAAWKGSSPEQCATARRSLTDSVAGLDRGHGVLVGALLEYPPEPGEQASLEHALDRGRHNQIP